MSYKIFEKTVDLGNDVTKQYLIFVCESGKVIVEMPWDDYSEYLQECASDKVGNPCKCEVYYHVNDGLGNGGTVFERIKAYIDNDIMTSQIQVEGLDKKVAKMEDDILNILGFESRY